MRILLLGVGMQGKAALYDLVQSDLVTEVTAADREIEALEAHVARQGYGRKVRCVPLDAARQSDVDALMALFDDSYTCWTAGNLPFSGTNPREVVPAMVEGVRGVFPEGLRFTVHTMTAEDDRVSVEAESKGKHVTGQTYNQLYHYLFVIRGGKIVQAKEYFDTMHANDVLCSAPAPGFNA